MGQLISSQGGKRSRDDLNVSTPVGSLPTKIQLENSIRYLPELKIGLEDEDFDLTRWEPQQLITTYLPHGSLRSETPRRRGKILIPSRDVGKHQTSTQPGVIKTIKETDDEQAVSSSDERHILRDEGDFTQSPIELSDTRDDEKNDELESVARNLSTRPRTQPRRKALMREVHLLLRSASVDDMAQVSSYLKTHEALLIPDSSDENSENFSDESLRRLRSSRRRGITSKSQLDAQASDERLLRRRSSTSRISIRSTRTSQEHILALKPSSAYLPSLRKSSSYQSFLRSSTSVSSSRKNSLSTQKTDDYPTLPLSRQTSSSRTLQSSIYSSSKGTFSGASSLWSPTSEETDIYRINILSNLHFCTYGCKEKSFKRKLDWIQHEEQIHEPPVIHTCLLHVSDTLSSDPCPSRLCVSTMNSDHLAHFHSSFSCFDKPAVSIERYQTEKIDLLLEHLRERHGLDFEMFPDYWSSESLRKTKWWCGFCRGILRSWKERADHISMHFTREARKMEGWKDFSHIPFPAMLEDTKPMAGLMVKELSLGGQFSLAQLRRLSVVRENQKDESDDEI